MTKTKKLPKITQENYYSDIDYLTNSMLGYLKQSPLHLHAYRKKILTRSSQALDFGSMYDALLLEPNTFDEVYCVMPEGMRRGTNAYKEWIKDYGKDKIVSHNEYIKAINMKDALLSSKTVEPFISIGDKQKIITWEDQGVPCKGKFDNYISGECIVDLKTAKSCSKDYFAHAVKYVWDYDRQAAWYRNGEGNNLDFYWVVQEKESPYISTLFHASEEVLLNGFEKYRELLIQYKLLFVDKPFDSRSITSVSP